MKRRSMQHTGQKSKRRKSEPRSELPSLSSETLTSTTDVCQDVEDVLLETTGNEREIRRKCNWFIEGGFDKLFKFEKFKSEKVFQVQCKLCIPMKALSVTSNSSFNLKSHLKKLHLSAHDQLFVEANAYDGKPNSDNVLQFLDNHARVISQTQFDKLVCNYIIELMEPFAVVEYESFKALVLSGKTRSLKVPTRKTVVQLMIREYQILKQGQMKEYAKINYFCVTTDLWSSRRIFSKDKDDGIFLPPHSRCASHGLCLTLTSDIKAKKSKKKKKSTAKNKQKNKFNRKFRRFRRNILDPVLAKCTALFNKQQQSTKAADLIHSHINRYLVIPCPTRWNALYDSLQIVSELLENKPSEMNSIFDALDLDRIQPEDYEVIKEYLQITESVSDTLDILQGEQYMYLGVYAPTICKLKEKVNEISNLKHCKLLQEAISKSLDERFADATSDENLMASLLHPLFKSYPLFVDYPELTSTLIKKLASELQAVLDGQVNCVNVNHNQSKTKDLSNIANVKKFQKLFDFNVDTGFPGSSVRQTSSLNAEAMIHKYLSSPITSFEIFNVFPEIGQLFIKHNTPLCSSAPSERLFSLAKLVFTAQRARLLDKNFEMQLLLKTNLFPNTNHNLSSKLLKTTRELFVLKLKS